MKAGCELYVNDLNKDAVAELVAAGAKEGDYETIGKECDIVLMILPNGAIVQSVLFGENGLAGYLKPGTVVCDMSSVTPTESCTCAEKLAEMQIGFVDSPVSGGEPKAIDGTLAFMAGGNEADFEKLKPYFDAMGASALLIGKSGSGSVTKLTNQVIVNLTIAAVSEAFVLCSKAGADPEKVYQAIRGGLAGSTVMDAKAPMMLGRNFKPGFRIELHIKDLNNALNAAHAISSPVPLTGQLMEIMQGLKADGFEKEDHSSIVKYYEKIANTTVEPSK